VPLGQEIGAMVEAVRDRVEVASHGETWHVTAGSFDGALAYARERFDEPVVLSRKDRGRWWPRVTLTVTRDPVLAAAAPDVATFATPAVHETPAGQPIETTLDPPSFASALEEIFAHQEELRLARRGIPAQRVNS